MGCYRRKVIREKHFQYILYEKYSVKRKTRMGSSIIDKEWKNVRQIVSWNNRNEQKRKEIQKTRVCSTHLRITVLCRWKERKAHTKETQITLLKRYLLSYLQFIQTVIIIRLAVWYLSSRKTFTVSHSSEVIMLWLSSILKVNITCKRHHTEVLMV